MTEDATLKAILDRLVDILAAQVQHEVGEMLDDGADLPSCRAHMAERFALFRAWGTQTLPHIYRHTHGITLQ